MNQPEITLKLSLDRLNIVIAGLGKLPLEASVEAWLDIKEQAEAQLKPIPVRPEAKDDSAS